MSLDHAIAEAARNQHSLVTFAQVRELGGGRQHLDRRERTGQLERLSHNVYRVGGAIPTWESRVLASVLGAGPGAVASHLTSGALFDLEGFSRAGRPELSIPRGRHHRPADARCHESTDLDRCSVVLRHGIPTTDLGRTLLDIGRYFGASRLGRTVESARRTHKLEWETLIHTLLRHARQGRHGIRRLRTVIALNSDRDEITDSDFELLALALLAEYGIPTPVLHHRIYAGDVLIAEVDLAWPDRKVATELDGAMHRDEPIWERDLVARVELQSMGWTVLPFSWRSYVTQPDWLIRKIRIALAAG